MPQMAPMSWSILFTIFILSFIFMMIMNYFNFQLPMINNKKILNYKSLPLNWKW